MPDIPIEKPPQIDLRRLPAEEHDHARALNDTLHEMHGYMEDFASALLLFDYSSAHSLDQSRRGNHEGSRNYRRWTRIAARDGAMSIYHFWHAMKGANGSIYKCPTLKALVDQAKLGAAIALMTKHFPRFESMRNAVAHSAEITKDKKATDKNSFSGSYRGPSLTLDDSTGEISGVIIKSGISGRTFTTTGYDGVILSYDISEATLKNLTEIAAEFFGALTG